MFSADEERTPGPDAEAYRGYMLRLWKEAPDAAWQGHLESVTTGQHYYFASLDDLMAFLRDEDLEPSGAGGGGQDEAAGEGMPASGRMQRTAAHSYQRLCQATLASVFQEARAYPQLASASMLEATSFEGGEDLVGTARRLLRAAVPAVLYASHPDVSYPQAYEDLVGRVNAALASGSRASMLALAEELEAGD
jgi:hypothetical protein